MKTSTPQSFCMSWDRAITVLPWALSAVAFVLMLLVSLLLPSQLGPTPQDWFAEYAGALRQGKLYVGEGTQWRDCKWDQSFFEGKCYLYWGIIPALIRMLIPFLTNRFVCILAAAVVMFLLSKILLRLAQLLKATEEIDWLLTSTTCLACFFASGFFGMALMARVYEESINVGHAFGLGGVLVGLSYLPGMNQQDRSIKSLLLASVCFGLAALTRFSWIPVFGLYVGFVLLAAPKKSLIPCSFLIFVLGFQGWLNQVRFGNPFEFGIQYQSTFLRFGNLQEPNIPNLVGNVLPNIICYYFLRLFPKGPLVVTNPHGFLQRLLLKNRLYEYPHTLLFSLPISFLAFLKRKELLHSIKKIWGPITLLLPLLVPTIFFNSNVNRYQFEICASFMLMTLPFLISKSSLVSSKEYSIQLVANLIGISASMYFDFEVLQRFWKLL